MAILEAIAATTEILDFSSKVSELLLDPRRKSKLKPVVKALGVIYFTPNGLVRALRTLSNGAEPDDVEMRTALMEFNQIEPAVHEAVRNLSFDSLSVSGLTLRQRRVLDEIAYGKLSLRADLQNALNESLTFGRKPDLEQVRVLLQRVEELNQAIEELEEKLSI